MYYLVFIFKCSDFFLLLFILKRDKNNILNFFYLFIYLYVEKIRVDWVDSIHQKPDKNYKFYTRTEFDPNSIKSNLNSYPPVCQV